jgi:hypothetical protein
MKNICYANFTKEMTSRALQPAEEKRRIYQDSIVRPVSCGEWDMD